MTYNLKPQKSLHILSWVFKKHVLKFNMVSFTDVQFLIKIYEIKIISKVFISLQRDIYSHLLNKLLLSCLNNLKIC